MADNHEEIINGLRILPCLASLDDGLIAAIAKIAFLKKASKNEVIFEEAEQVKFFFAVKKGAIKLYKTSLDGRELAIRIIRDNDFFCCAPVYAGGGYFVNAQALEDSNLIAIPSDGFKEMLCSEMGEIGLGMLSSLCIRLKSLSNLLEDVTFRDVEHRIMLALLRMAEEKSKENTVSLSLTHHDIASITGSVRVVVSRTMSRLKKQGIILMSSHRGFVLDKDKLRAKITDPYINV
jgi:CRP/FNR family transcriptional regulator